METSLPWLICQVHSTPHRIPSDWRSRASLARWSNLQSIDCQTGTREVFMLRQVEGMSTEEVADALNVSEAVVKTRLSRARGAIRRELFQHAGLEALEHIPVSATEMRPRCARRSLTDRKPSSSHATRAFVTKQSQRTLSITGSRHTVTCRARRTGASVMRLIGGAAIAFVLTLTFMSVSAPAQGQRSQDGQAVFRFDTFGDEQLWTDVLRMNDAIVSTVSPTTALSVGLKVDVRALPPTVIKAIKAGEIDLNDPAVTLTLLKLNAVVGVMGRRRMTLASSRASGSPVRSVIRPSTIRLTPASGGDSTAGRTTT